MQYKEIDMECKMRYFIIYLVEVLEIGNIENQVEGGGNFERENF